MWESVKFKTLYLHTKCTLHVTGECVMYSYFWQGPVYSSPVVNDYGSQTPT